MVTAGIFWALLLVSARSVTGLPIRRRLMHEVAVASPGLCFMFHRLSVRAAPSFFYRLVFASVLQTASCIKLSDTENDVWSTQRSPLYKICRSDEGCAGWAAMGLPFRLLGKVN